MKVFVAWHGARGKQIAEILEVWLPLICPTALVWVSTGMPKGSEWRKELAKNANEASAGILCVTPDAVGSNWLHFEAGAIWKGDATEAPKIFPLLFNAKASDLGVPLSDFQITEFEKLEYVNLAESLWSIEKSTHRPSRQVIEKILEVVWDEYERQVRSVFQSTVDIQEEIWGAIQKSRSVDILYSTERRGGAAVNATTYENELRAIIEIFKLPITKYGATTSLVAQAASRKTISELRRATILIGGPRRNQASQNLIKNINRKNGVVQFTAARPDNEREDVKPYSALQINNSIYEVQYGDPFDPRDSTAGWHVEKDYGIAIRATHATIPIVLLGGCHAYGTHAAAIGLTHADLLHSVHEQLNSLGHLYVSPNSAVIMVFEVEVDGGMLVADSVRLVEGTVVIDF